MTNFIRFSDIKKTGFPSKTYRTFTLFYIGNIMDGRHNNIFEFLCQHSNSKYFTKGRCYRGFQLKRSSEIIHLCQDDVFSILDISNYWPLTQKEKTRPHGAEFIIIKTLKEPLFMNLHCKWYT